jgi:two-component system, OmpR family, sensor histidine kinase QseC
VKSIRLFLIAATVAILLLYNFIAAVRGYQSSMLEADMLFDNQLLDLSRLVGNLDTARLTPEFRLGNNLAFQIWEGEHLLAASWHAPAEPMNPLKAGFDFANFDGYRWRTYTRLDEATGRWIVVAERTDLRFVLAENVVLESVTPILVGIPIAGLLIWMIVGFGLRPLAQLSADLREKRAQDLSPLPQRQTPKELDQVVQSVNGFIQRLDGALEREKRFSADAAHELRTPIAALKIQLHNLAQEVGSGSESFRQLQQGVERMQHLVEQLLSLYRMTPSQFAAHCTRLDLLAVTQEVVARHYPLIEQKQQNVELEGTNAFIIGERFAIETLLANLLANAIRYTPAGGNIRLRVETVNGKVSLTVADDGPGIPASEREQVFERFHRGVQAGEDRASGCGLGLTIVKHVAELHQADVAVGDSGFGTGAAFRVNFPEARDAA